MTEQDRIIKHISLSKFKDPRIVKEVVYHPLYFAKKVMTDPDDYRPIRIRYFGVFILKAIHNKTNFKLVSYIVQALRDHPNLYKIFVDPVFKTTNAAIHYVLDLFYHNQDIDSIKAIHSSITKAISEE